MHVHVQRWRQAARWCADESCILMAAMQANLPVLFLSSQLRCEHFGTTARLVHGQTVHAMPEPAVGAVHLAVAAGAWIVSCRVACSRTAPGHEIGSGFVSGLGTGPQYATKLLFASHIVLDYLMKLFV